MSTDDKLSILEAIARYSFAFDRQDANGWVEIFAPDGVFEVYPHGGNQPSNRWAGAEQLRSYAVDSFERRLLDARVRHFQTNTLFQEVRGEAASSITMVLITHIGPPDEKLRVTFTGAYEDLWVKLDGQWKLAHRTLRTDS